MTLTIDGEQRTARVDTRTTLLGTAESLHPMERIRVRAADHR